MTSEIYDSQYKEVILALKQLSRVMEGNKNYWLLGGSCGLWLQGVELGAAPRDVDIYADLVEAFNLHVQLSELSIDEPHMDESGQYKSRLSHYQLGNLTLELVGGFEVRNDHASYVTDINGVLYQNASGVDLEGEQLILMPLAHELLFNVLRGREDRYIPIAAMMRSSLDQHLPLVRDLIARNEINQIVVNTLEELLQVSTLHFSSTCCESSDTQGEQ